MFNEAKPIYIKHFTPPLFFDSSDFYLLIRYLSIFRNQILSIRINLIAKKQSYLKKHIFKYDIHLSYKIIFL